jgi:hypothetical protein
MQAQKNPHEAGYSDCTPSLAYWLHYPAYTTQPQICRQFKSPLQDASVCAYKFFRRSLVSAALDACVLHWFVHVVHVFCACAWCWFVHGVSPVYFVVSGLITLISASDTGRQLGSHMAPFLYYCFK